MKKVIIAVALLAFGSSAQAINHAHRALLEKSGCTQSNEGQGCDIHKSKEWNEAHARKSAGVNAEDLLGRPIDEAYAMLTQAGYSNTQPYTWVNAAGKKLMIETKRGVVILIESVK